MEVDQVTCAYFSTGGVNAQRCNVYCSNEMVVYC